MEVLGNSGTASPDREPFLLSLHAGVGATAFVRASVNTGNARLVSGSVTNVLEAWIHSYGVEEHG